MAKLLYGALACVSVLSLFIDQGDAACCPCSFPSKGQCADKTPCTPCCSGQPCNIFCCNCNGCRGGITSKTEDDASGFQEIDLDGDGFVDRGEAHAHLKSGRCGNFSEKINSFHDSFKLLDRDGDNKLTYAEIDSDM